VSLNRVDLWRLDRSSMMTWPDLLFQVHIIVNHNNVVWFSIRPTTHRNLTHRSPTLWMEYLYPNLTLDWHNSDNLDNNPSPNRTNPSRIVCLFMLVLHALFVIFHVCILLLGDARLRRIEDMREPDGVQRTGIGDTGIGRGYNHRRMEASPNIHPTPPSTLHAIP